MSRTDAQIDAIESLGRSLLVSAAAGSGKTTVLAERCAFVVADAAPRASVEELLVVTFTKEAARQMRDRIADVLRRAAAARPLDTHLLRQIALVDRARISTLHSFCEWLIRRHVADAGVDPDARILGEEEGHLLRVESAELLLDAWLAGPRGAEMQELIDRYGGSDGASIIRLALSIHAFLESIVDPGPWLARARARYRTGGGVPEVLLELQAQEMARELEAAALAGLREAGRIRAREPAGAPFASIFEEWAEDIRVAIRDIRDRARARSARDRIRAARDAIDAIAFRRAPSVRKDAPPDLVRAKEMFGAARDRLKKRLPGKMAAFSPEDDEASLRDADPHARVLLAFVKAFRARYAEAKREAQAIDFGDLEREALRILRGPARREIEPSPLALALRERFSHVLVDEFQDINPVQEAILRLVSRPGDASGAGGNLFAVGDVKQSIYRFRLAEPAIFARMDAEYAAGRGGRRILLRENFRSRPEILEAVNAIFERLIDGSLDDVRYGVDARLIAGLERPASDAPIFRGPAVELHAIEAPPRRRSGGAAGDGEGEDGDEGAGARAEGRAEDETEAGGDLERLEREALLAGARILALIDGRIEIVERGRDGTPVSRPLAYRDVVILMRSLKHRANDFARVLAQLGIPCTVQLSSGFFDAMEIRDVLSLLAVLDNPLQDIPLAACLRSPYGRRSAEDLLRIRRFRPDLPFHEAVLAYAAAGDEHRLRHVLAWFLARLDGWRGLARRKPLAEALWRIYEESGVLAYVAGLAGGASRRANLIALHDRAREFGRFSRQGLARFLRFLEDLRAREVEIGSAPPAGEGEDAVRILSIHAAKGLEFPVVVIPDLGKKINLADAQGDAILDRELGVALRMVDPDLGVKYPTLLHRLAAERARRLARAEELRVLYVALTRAREHLILIGTIDEGKLDEASDLWEGHAGPLPPDVIGRAERAIEWILPAAIAAGARAVDEIPAPDRPGTLFALRRIPDAEASRWILPGEPREDDADDAASRFVDLPSVWPECGADPDAEMWMRRLRWTYPHDPFTRVPAVRSVSELKGRHRPESDPDIREPRPPLPAAALGEATHRFLQAIDLRRSCDAADLSAQRDALVREGRLGEDEARAIDLDEIAWFFATEVGQGLLRDPASVLRELPFAISADPAEIGLGPAASDPRDRVLVRGVIDVVVRGEAGLEVLDYKTDRVSGEALDARIRGYGEQIRLYARALERIAGERIAAARLVFLKPRRIVPIAWP
ncbi:MAG: UvrD-helicase domain-containing protein [Planctomycetes bacterium]|nr:UvrD-helicase domain-containing protein [Planctomycetota bacterium]